MRDAKVKLYRKSYSAVWIENGKTRRAALHTKDIDEAERNLADLKRANAGKLETVADIMEAYLADRDGIATAPERLRYAWKALKPTFGHLRPDQIDRALCRRYAATRGGKVGTVIKELTVLRAGLRWQNPNTPAIVEIPPGDPPRDRYLTRDEYGRLLAMAGSPHMRLFIVLALASAGRMAAILNLTWDRVDFVRGRIALGPDISRGARGVGDVPRRKGRATVPMNDTARAALLEAQKSALSPYVIEYAGKRVASIKKAFQRTARKAGMPDVTPHVLRHTAAVWMVEAGVSMDMVAQYLGHSDSRITARVYGRFQPDFMKDAAKALEA